MHKCLICSSKNTTTVKAVVAGFVSHRMYNSQRVDTELIHCKECGFAFFALRPDTENMSKLYSGYRNEKYQKDRQKYESWYTPEMNALIGDNQFEIENRKKNLLKVLGKYKNISDINSVLDFGGDKGQHIPDLNPSCKKYVYDISGIKTLDNVTLIKDFSAVSGKHFDLIMCCHTLEHVSDPAEIVQNIREIGSKDSLFYFELPFDSPFYGGNFDKIKLIFSTHFKLKDTFKKAINMLKECKPQMHEHINYFTPEALRILLENNNFKVIFNDTAILDFDWCKQKVVSVLARKL